MNEIYQHPISGRKIEGFRLGPGAKIRPTDLYDCSDGTWREAADSLSGMRLWEDCATIWIRPQAAISAEALALLEGLKETGYCLVDGPPRWKIIPSIEHRADERLDWQVLHPEHIQDLIDYGFLRRIPNEFGIYQISGTGRVLIAS